MYCSHHLSNDDIEVQRQEVTKSIELVSDIIKNCVHSSELCGGLVKITWEWRGAARLKASSLSAVEEPRNHPQKWACWEKRPMFRKKK